MSDVIDGQEGAAPRDLPAPAGERPHRVEYQTDEERQATRNKMWSGIVSFHSSIIDRYLFREFIVSFLAVMAFCALLMLVASIFDKFDDILSNDPPFRAVLMYFVCSLPYKLMQIVPMASMLAVLFSIGTLARNNEILAMMTSGVASLRIAAPVVFGGVLIAVASLAINEFVVPPLEQQAQFYEQRLAGKDVAKIAKEKDVFVRGRENRFYLMRVFDSSNNTMIRPQIYDTTSGYNGLRKRIEAATAKFIKEDKKAKLSQWELTNARIWEFDEQGKLIKGGFKEFKKPMVVSLEEDLLELVSQQKEPEQMNFFELRDYVRMLAIREQSVSKFQTDLILKLTFPLGVLIVMIIGFSYAVRTRAGTVMTAFGHGLVWAFAYYGFNALMKALGQSGAVAPLFAGLFPIMVFVGVSYVMLKRSSRWYA